MSHADYIWKIAESLRRDVSSDVTAEPAREALQNCVRALTAIANAWGITSNFAVPEPALTSFDPSILLIAGPPDNPACRVDTVAFITQAASRINADTVTRADLLSWVAWEKHVVDEAVGRMDGVECLERDAQPDGRLIIDRDRLQAYLRRAADAPDLRIVQFRAALGGRSRQTALFEVEAAAALPRGLVVQRSLPGMLRSAAFPGPAVEFAVLQKLHAAGMKVPRPVFVETGDDDLAAPFIIVERSPGDVVEADYWAVSASPGVVRDLATQMALLHTLPVGALAEILPQPRAGAGQAALVAELQQLETLWRTNAHGASVTMAAALRWLHANVHCVGDRTTLVHNDMVFHNILAAGNSITAVLDWEQASIGHPGEDLGYCYPVVSRLVDWNRFMADYVAAGGPSLSQREVDFFSLRAVLRLAGLVQFGRKAFESGQTHDIVVAGAGAFFLQRLMHRLGNVLDDVLNRDQPRSDPAPIEQHADGPA